jgi:protein dithiol:quinone oxidoreductase
MFLKYNNQFSFLGLILSVGALGSAVWLQQVHDWYPCALCILQRYCYLGSALGFLGLMVFRTSVSARQKPVGFPLFLYFITAVVMLGMGVALYHVWVLANPGQSCGVDPIQVKLNALPWTPLWPTMFEADGLCTAEYPPFLGLSLPMWSAVGFLAQLGLVALSWKAFHRMRR